MNLQRTDQRARADREELVERLGEAAGRRGSAEALPGLFFSQSSSSTRSVHSISRPIFCIIAQGSKQLSIGGHLYHYDPNHYLVATLDLPVVSRVIEASIERPYLGLGISLESTLVSSVLLETAQSAPRLGPGPAGVYTSCLDAGLLDAVLRLVRLLDTPSEAPLLAPLIQKEIVFRLLNGEQGDRLRHVAPGGHSHRIAQAVARLRREFDQPLRVEQLARELGMSTSGFHSHFKAITSLTPLQFQKQIRLQEARSLMLAEGLDAAGAGHRVGYEDASHFSREYKSFFGDAPMRDVERLRLVEHSSKSYRSVG